MLKLEEVKQNNGNLIQCLECGWIHVTFKEEVQNNSMCIKCGGIQWIDVDDVNLEHDEDMLFPCIDKE